MNGPRTRSGGLNDWNDWNRSRFGVNYDPATIESSKCYLDCPIFGRGITSMRAITLVLFTATHTLAFCTHGVSPGHFHVFLTFPVLTHACCLTPHAFCKTRSRLFPRLPRSRSRTRSRVHDHVFFSVHDHDHGSCPGTTTAVFAPRSRLFQLTPRACSTFRLFENSLNVEVSLIWFFNQKRLERLEHWNLWNRMNPIMT